MEVPGARVAAVLGGMPLGSDESDPVRCAGSEGMPFTREEDHRFSIRKE